MARKKKPSSQNSNTPKVKKTARPAAPSARKRHKILKAQAKHLKKEGKRLLKKFGARISEESGAIIQEAIVTVDHFLQTPPKDATSNDATGTGQEETPEPSASAPTEIHDPGNLEAMALAVENLDEILDERVGFGRKTVLREYAESIGYAVLVALFIRTFFLEAFQIPSGSMLPTLGIDDHIFVNKLSYGLHVPTDLFGVPIPFVGTEEACEHCYTTKGNQKRNHVRRPRFFGSMPNPGDVIVFACPDEKSGGVDYIKRVVAIPGQKIRLVQNRLVIDGQEVPTEIKKRIAACNMSDKASAPHFCTCTVQKETLGETPHLTQHIAQTDYLVSSEDTLDTVATRFRISPSALFEWNKDKFPSDIQKPEDLRVPLHQLGFAGQEILLGDEDALKQWEENKPFHILELPDRHEVQAGESLNQIATRYNTTPWDICSINLDQFKARSDRDKYLVVSTSSNRHLCLTLDELQEHEGPNPFDAPLPTGMDLALIRRHPKCSPMPNWPLPRCDVSFGPRACFGAKTRKNPVHFPDVKLPEDHVLTFGDNRDNSEDGRFWGLVPLHAIKGHAVFRWWATDLGTLGSLPQAPESENN